MPCLVSLRLLTWVSHPNLAAFKILKLLFKLFQSICNHEHPQHNRSQPYWFLTMALFKVLCPYCLPTDGVWTGEPPIHKLTVETTCDTQNKCTRKMDRAMTDRPLKWYFLWRNYLLWQEEFTFCKLSFFIAPYMCRRILFLGALVPHIEHTRGYSLLRTVDDNKCLSKIDPLVPSGPSQCTDLLQRLLQRFAGLSYFFHCRPRSGLIPVFWLPMTTQERSHCIR